jgi:hypothetical protein
MLQYFASSSTVSHFSAVPGAVHRTFVTTSQCPAYNHQQGEILMNGIRTVGAQLLSFATILGLGVALVLPIRAQVGKSALGPVGTVWGGEHIALEVTADGATLEFDCATASITKPLTVDAKGNFRAEGTFTRERPGPTMRNGNPAASATFSGSIAGNTLHLHISSGAKSDGGEDYVLLRDQPGRVMKCR